MQGCTTLKLVEFYLAKGLTPQYVKSIRLLACLLLFSSYLTKALKLATDAASRNSHPFYEGRSSSPLPRPASNAFTTWPYWCTRFPRANTIPTIFPFDSFLPRT